MAIGSIMCFGSSSKDDPDAKKSKEIEKQLREDQKRLAKEVKLLLLGKHTHTYTHTLIHTQSTQWSACGSSANWGLYRCGRVRQVYSTQADAPDSHQGFLKGRAKAMEGHHLPEPAARVPSSVRCNGRAGC